MTDPRIGSVTVVGAGVMGLSCAVRLAEAGLAVDVVAREMGQATTSSVAGGLWMPYLVHPIERVATWGRASLAEFLRLHADGRAPVVVSDGALLYTEPKAAPPWLEGVADLVDARDVTEPIGGYSHGLQLRCPIADMPHYLPYLTQRLLAAGGTVERADLSSLPSTGLVVNTTGLGARQLAGDLDLVSVRGQVALLDNPGLSRWLNVDEDGEHEQESLYVFPRRDDVVVGGSAHVDDWRLGVDDALAQRMLTRALELVPELAGARLREHRVGLRPVRPMVRLEADVGPERTVIHCYGHGGAGVTLSWGCADEVLALALAHVGSPRQESSPAEVAKGARRGA